MRIRLMPMLAAAALLAGCTLPQHVTEVMPDEKLCDVHKWTIWYSYKNNDNTRDVINAERERRGQPACPEKGSEQS